MNTPHNKDFPILARSAIEKFKQISFELLADKNDTSFASKQGGDLQKYLYLSTYDHSFEVLKSREYYIDGLKLIWNLDFFLKSSLPKIRDLISDPIPEMLTSLRLQAASVFSILNANPEQISNYIHNYQKFYPDIAHIQYGRLHKVSSMRHLELPYKLLIATLVCNKWASLLQTVPINGENGRPKTYLECNDYFTKFMSQVDSEIAYYAIRSQISLQLFTLHSLHKHSKMVPIVNEWKRIINKNY